jgi:hypothetical protein
MISNLVNRIPSTAVWYLGCAAAAGYFLITNASWLNVGIVFLLYVAGLLFSQLEYKRGTIETTRAHNEAMEVALAENREWIEKYIADKNTALAA